LARVDCSADWTGAAASNVLEVLQEVRPIKPYLWASNQLRKFLWDRHISHKHLFQSPANFFLVATHHY
jgi:hypothetical protein